MGRICLFFIFFGLLLAESTAQAIQTIYIYTIDPRSQATPIKKIVTDKTIESFCFAYIDSLHQQGYLEASLHSNSASDSGQILEINKGKLYVYEKIYTHAIEADLIKKFKLQSVSEQKFQYIELKQLIQNISNKLENEGYQYAKVFLDSSELKPDAVIHSSLHIHTGPVVYIDTIHWEDEPNLPHKLIQRLMPIRGGDVFSKAIVDMAYEKISSIHFLEMYSIPQISFYREKATIKFFIKEKKLNHIDALLGLLPAGGTDDKLKLNGTFNAALQNQFGLGESLQFNFQSLQNSSQQFKSEIEWPYPFNLPFYAQGRFSLYRRDSLFQDIKGEMGVSWDLRSNSRFSINAGILNSFILRPDLETILRTKTLPAALDMKHSFVNAVIFFQQLPQGLISTKGYKVTLFSSAYTRKIVPTLSITSLKDPIDSSFSFESLYAPTMKKGYSIELGADGIHFTKLSKHATWFKNLRLYYKNASTPLQVNELYRLGGFNSLRGFDEESLLASRYLLLKNELRLMTGERGYLYIHSDFSWMQNWQSTNRYIQNKYLSLGAGIVLDTSLGLLSVASSVGNQLPIGFNWRAVKLHVGYINYF